MAVEMKRAPGAGHPWTGDGEWDLLEVRTDTAEELQRVIEGAFAKFWQPWIRGVETLGDKETGRYAATLYKPTGAARPWIEQPGGDGRPELTWLPPGDRRWVVSGPDRQRGHPAAAEVGQPRGPGR